MDSHLRPELARMVQAAMAEPDQHVPFFADSREDVLSPETLETIAGFLGAARHRLGPDRVPPSDVDLETVYLAACYFWARCRFLSEEQSRWEHRVSLALLSVVHAIRPESVPQPRRAQFARHPDEPAPVADILHGTAMILAAGSGRHRRESGLWTAVALLGYARDAVTGGPAPELVFDHGVLFAGLHEFTGDPDHLRAAVALMRKAVAMFPGEAPETMLTTLARTREQAEKAQQPPEPLPGDVERDTASARDSLAGIRRDSPDYGRLLTALGTALHRRFAVFGSLGDLAEAIRCLETAVAHTPMTRDDQPAARIALALALADRGKHAGQPGDLDRATTLLSEVTTDPAAGEPHRRRARHELARLPDRPEPAREEPVVTAHDIPFRLRAAYSRGLRCALLGHADQASRAFGHALDDLLPKLSGSPRGIPSPAGDAAAVALERGSPAEALVRLEQGRAAVLAAAVGLRPHAELAARHPGPARRLAESCATLNHDAASARDRRRAEDDFRETVSEIRALPGFDRFLRHRDFWSLRKAAAQGPVVVVNVAELGCAALLVAPGADAPEVVPLPGVTRPEVFHRAEAFLAAATALSLVDGQTERAGHDRTVTTTLDWLWDHIAGPVLKALDLDEHSEEGPRLWWCPTGPLSLLPLHAARCAADGSHACDRVVSSYTPTLGALLDARARRETTVRPFLGVGAGPRHAVDAELAALPRHPSLLVGTRATRDAVLAAIRSRHRAHFACHTEHDPAAPSRSGLALHDGPLTVRELAAEQPDGEFAFLLTGHTLPGGPGDETLTLAAACRLAGYRHVVGSLWPTGTEVRRLLTRELYRLLSPTADDTALALHRATRRLRTESRYATTPFWASFVHIGP
ncbi:CHAT domain-containing protein [Amycolatopsis samaneae]|uniref:CHAT domain-containing protein n=1 Tax=Amycolatopsis samaneae TaxID=664691 RepID=A0ABW5G988_9PSEU